MANMKIYQQTNILLAQPQVGNNLCFMNGRYLLNALEFYHNGIIDQQIDPITKINPNSFINYGKINLVFNIQTLLSEFVREASFISALEKPRSQR